MPLLRTKTEPPVADDASEAAEYVLALSRLSQHPLLAPLYERRSALRQRLDTLEVEHDHLTRVLADYVVG